MKDFKRWFMTKISPATFALIMALALACATAVGCSSNSSEAGSSAGTPIDTAPSATSTESAATPTNIGVNVTISSQVSGETLLEVENIALTEPFTPLNALEESGADIVVSDGPYGAYVESINGIENGSAGETSGWIYTDNDQEIMEASDAYTLVAGDTVQWTFVESF